MAQVETKKVTYHIGLDDPAPCIGQYMVFVGKKGILSVHLIKSVRRVIPRFVSDVAKYALELLPRPDLKPYTESETYPSGYVEVWVRGEPALPSYWMPRTKKKD